MTNARPVLLCLFLAFAAFPSVAASTEPAEAQPAVEHAPTPFTAEQIRDAMPVGTQMRFSLEVAGAASVSDWTVTAADAESVTISFVTEDPEGEETEPRQPATFTWAELRTHALYPADATTIEDARVEVPAGTFQTRRYTVRSEVDGAPSVTVYDFAVELPGPPVRFVTTADGAVTTTWLLLSRSPRPRSK